MTAVLSLNVGSSSLKAAGFVRTGAELKKVFTATHDASAGDTELVVHRNGTAHTLGRPGEDYREGALALLAHAGEVLGGRLVVGHRVVHGGRLSGAPVRLDAGTIDRLRAFAPLAPLHQIANLAPAEALLEARPDLFQTASFDTSFHETMPETSRQLPLPASVTGETLRRYGFHGLSFRSVARRMAGHGFVRIVALHLGGGASVCAMRDGRSIDTTMGATPLAGPMMTTRAGSVDPGVLLHLLERGHDTERLADLLWKKSGLLGVSEESSDLRDLIGSGSAAAETAVELFCADLVRHTGAMVARLGGMDAVVFTGGAGAGQPLIRERVAEAFDWAGLRLDAEGNAALTEQGVAPQGSRISAPDSGIEAWVLPVDEETEIARDACQLSEEEDL
ncbi:acetate/propionate family kinase [Celeribacter indicus]|uniref:Acetate kinase n=1 Tax=Celeribacter indicus TaxID=1208324 RepID=A0A0B5E6G2_9RHOB|nr:hypothetical protein [Celeribacter indicus]AJE49040.1 Acetate kinase [Celeribacter indicus]SDW44386.1 acetate kinase [Celeribacter indicus]